MIDHSEKHRSRTRKTRRNRSHFAARRRGNFLSFARGARPHHRRGASDFSQKTGFRRFPGGGAGRAACQARTPGHEHSDGAQPRARELFRAERRAARRPTVADQLGRGAIDLAPATIAVVTRRGDPSADQAALAKIASAVLHTLAIRSRAGDSRASLTATADAAIRLICGTTKPVKSSKRRSRLASKP
jgi:hypothetical protein